MDDKAETPGGCGDESAQSLHDKRLEARAIREGWNVPQDIRIQILKRLCGYIDPDSGEKPRTVIQAARTVIAAELGDRRVTVSEEALKLKAGAGDTNEDVHADAAERIRRRREERGGEAG